MKIQRGPYYHQVRQSPELRGLRVAGGGGGGGEETTPALSSIVVSRSGTRTSNLTVFVPTYAGVVWGLSLLAWVLGHTLVEQIP